MQQFQILSVGSGGCGILLQLDLQDSNIPRPLKGIEVDQNLKIKFNGLIGLFKSNTALCIYGQLNTLITIPKQLSLQKVTKFTCGWQHALIQCDSRIFGIGSNKFYELGLPNKQIYDDPQLIMDCQAIDLACGFRQSFIIRKSDILVTGQNKNNELCSNDFQVAEKFTVIEVGNLKSIKCGQKFTLALTNDNQLYGWGSNTFGQLAQNQEKIIQKKLLMENVKHFDCGWSHQILLTTCVYVCGRGDLGQQGDNLRQNNYEYKKVNIIGTNVKCGSESTIIVTQNEMYVTGWNEHGNLGLGNNQNVYQFEILNGFDKVKCKGASMLLYQGKSLQS